MGRATSGMLKAMKQSTLCRNVVALLILCAALPALADTRFQVRRMTRNDVPLGKGQCDIRLQVDNEVEVAVRRDQVSIRTISGRDARDDGSECNEPLPGRDFPGFNFQVMDSRNEIRMLAEPSPPKRFHCHCAHPGFRWRRGPLPFPPLVADDRKRFPSPQRSLQ